MLFEVWPKPGRRVRYFDLAAALAPQLATIDRFLSIERFESLAQPGKLLSLSFWRDEAAVAEPKVARACSRITGCASPR